MKVIGIVRLRHRVLPALVFALLGKGLEPERETTSRIQSQLWESARNTQEYQETRTVSAPAKNRSRKSDVPGS